MAARAVFLVFEIGDPASGPAWPSRVPVGGSIMPKNGDPMSGPVLALLNFRIVISCEVRFHLLERTIEINTKQPKKFKEPREVLPQSASFLQVRR